MFYISKSKLKFSCLLFDLTIGKVNFASKTISKSTFEGFEGSFDTGSIKILLTAGELLNLNRVRSCLTRKMADSSIH